MKWTNPLVLIDVGKPAGVPTGKPSTAQLAYLVAGEPLDRAVLIGTTPPREHVIACAREGVETFLARHGAGRGGRVRKG